MKNQTSRTPQPDKSGAVLASLEKTLRRLIFIFKLHRAVILLYRHGAERDCAAAVEIKRVDSANVADAGAYEAPATIDRFKKYLRKGDWGYYAYREGEWVHRSWVALGPQTVKLWKRFLPFRLEERESLIWNSETAAAFRGRSIYATVLSRIVRDLKANNFHTIYIATNDDNLASQQAILKAGFQELERKKVIGFLGLTFAGKAG